MACSGNHLGCPRFIKNENKTFIRPDFVSNKTILCAGEFKEILMSIIQMSVGLDFRNVKLMSYIPIHL